ncbi:unnamed protein product [Linum trigynum]|uniref:RNase H type-1 domain-containing protein n=1 Tax=Linum trigynum TaxID=586398 RepID=A0AAV2DWF2_9ROSI
MVKCSDLRGDRDCFDWFEKVMKTVDEGSLEAWFVLLWFLWKERNSQLFNGSKIPEHEIVGRAAVYLEEYKRQKARGEVDGDRQIEKGWQRLVPDRVKINTDAGLLEGGGAGLGAIARDADGKCIFAAAKKVRNVRRWKWQKLWQRNLGYRLHTN